MLSLIRTVWSFISDYLVYLIIAACLAVTIYLGWSLLKATETIRTLEVDNHALRVSIEHANSTIAGLEAQIDISSASITDMNDLLSRCYDDKAAVVKEYQTIQQNMQAVSQIPEENLPKPEVQETYVSIYQNEIGITYVNNLMRGINSMFQSNISSDDTGD